MAANTEIKPIVPGTETDKIVYEFFKKLQEPESKKKQVFAQGQHPEQIMKPYYDGLLAHAGGALTKMYLENPLFNNAMNLLMRQDISVALVDKGDNDPASALFAPHQYYAKKYQSAWCRLSLFRVNSHKGEGADKDYAFEKFEMIVNTSMVFDTNGRLDIGSVYIHLSMMPEATRNAMVEALFKLMDPATAVPLILGAKRFEYALEFVKEKNEYWSKTLLGETPFPEKL